MRLSIKANLTAFTISIHPRNIYHRKLEKYYFYYGINVVRRGHGKLITTFRILFFVVYCQQLT